MDELGLGRGLTVTPKDYTGMLGQAYVQQGAREAREQQNQEELMQYYMKNVDIDKSKFHRLVMPEATAATDEYIGKLIEAKAEGNMGFQSRAARILGDYKTKLGELSTITNQYATFEKVYSDPTKKVYKTANTEAAYKAMTQAKTYKDLPGLFEKNGVKLDYDFAYDPNGNIFYTPQTQFDFGSDFNKFARNNSAQAFSDITTRGAITTYLKNKNTFRDQTDIRKFEQDNKLPVGTIKVMTAKDHFESLLVDAEAKNQFIDMYNRTNPEKIDVANLDINDEGKLFEFYDKVYNTSRSNVSMGMSTDKSTTVNVNVDTKNKEDMLFTKSMYKVGDKEYPAFTLPPTFKVNFSPSGFISQTLDENLQPVDKTGVGSFINKNTQGESVAAIRVGDKNYVKFQVANSLGIKEFFVPLESLATVFQVATSKEDYNNLVTQLSKLSGTENTGTPTPTTGTQATGTPEITADQFAKLSIPERSRYKKVGSGYSKK